MAHEHELKCGGCGNELWSLAQSRCTHCGVNDPLTAAPNSGHQEMVGTPEIPRTVGGLTIDKLLELLEREAPLLPSRRKATVAVGDGFGWKPAA